MNTQTQETPHLWLCMLKHDWSRWKVVPVMSSSPLLQMLGKGGEPELGNGQERVCQRCGRKQLESI